MNYEGYCLIFFIFIGLLIIIYYYNLQPQYSSHIHHPQYPEHNKNVLTAIKVDDATNRNRMNMNDDHLKIYNDYSKYKKTNNIDSYTYNIDNIDILKDNPINNNKLGSPNNDNYDHELEEVYNTTLRGDKNHSNKLDEVYDYSIKPNKTDLPIVNPPLQLLKNNAPLRLSERHFL